MPAGTRVTFPGMRGGERITFAGTVIPSNMRRWTLVRLDSGRILEVHADNLTPVH